MRARSARGRLQPTRLAQNVAAPVAVLCAAVDNKTVLDEFYRIAFRKKIYGSIAELQADLDDWVQSYNVERPHQGRWCFGKTPMQTFLDAKLLAQEKLVAA